MDWRLAVAWGTIAAATGLATGGLALGIFAIIKWSREH